VVVPNVVHMKLAKAKARIRAALRRREDHAQALGRPQPGPSDQAGSEGERDEAAERLQGQADRR
jgi:hypothetical protein